MTIWLWPPRHSVSEAPRLLRTIQALTTTACSPHSQVWPTFLKRGLTEVGSGHEDERSGYFIRDSQTKAAHPLLLIEYFSIGMALSSFSILPIFGLPYVCGVLRLELPQ